MGLNEEGKEEQDYVLKNFAGININANMKGIGSNSLMIDGKPDGLNMSLKQYLIAQDKINFNSNFGNREKDLKNRKRGRPANRPEGESG